MPITLNSEPIVINGVRYNIRPDNRSGKYSTNKLYAYVHGQGNKGRKSLGIEYDPQDTERNLKIAVRNLRGLVGGDPRPTGVRDPKAPAVKFWERINEPLYPSELTIANVLQFARHHQITCTARGDIKKIDSVEHALRAHFGDTYDTLTVEQFTDGRFREWLKFFVSDKYVPPRGTQSDNTKWNNVVALAAALNTTTRSDHELISDGDGGYMCLLNDRPQLSTHRKTFEKMLGRKILKGTRDYFGPQDLAAVLDACDLNDKHDLRLYRWLHIAFNCPGRVGVLLQANWKPGAGQVHGNYRDWDSFHVLQQQTADTRTGQKKVAPTVRITPRFYDLLCEWNDERPIHGWELMSLPGNDGKPITQRLQKKLKELGIEKERCTARIGRYALETWLEMQKVYPMEIARLLGHSIPGQTFDYHIIEHPGAFEDSVLAIDKFWQEVDEARAQ